MKLTNKYLWSLLLKTKIIIYVNLTLPRIMKWMYFVFF